MPKYHESGTICKAQPGNCPFGDGEHFDTKADAIKAGEERLAKERGGSFGTKLEEAQIKQLHNDYLFAVEQSCYDYVEGIDDDDDLKYFIDSDLEQQYACAEIVGGFAEEQEEKHHTDFIQIVHKLKQTELWNEVENNDSDDPYELHANYLEAWAYANRKKIMKCIKDAAEVELASREDEEYSW